MVVWYDVSRDEARPEGWPKAKGEGAANIKKDYAALRWTCIGVFIASD